MVSLIVLTAVAVLLGSCGKPSPLVVGGLVSETGAAAAYGQQIRKGMDLALDEVNAQGGFPNGRELRIEYRDDASSPEKAKAAVSEMLDRMRVNALLGGTTSAVAEAVIPLVVEREVVMLSPSASSPSLTSIGGGWFFRNYPSDMVEVQEVADLAQRLDLDTVAVVAYNSAFGKSLAEVFENQFKAANGKVPLVEMFDAPLPSKDADVIARKVLAASPKGVYLAGYINEVAGLLQALQTAGFKGVKLASSAVTPDIIRISGVAAERLVFPQARLELEGNDPALMKFVEKFKTKYGAPPQVWAAYGYDAVKVFAEALRRTRLGSAGEIRAQLVNVNYRGVTGPINFDTRGDVRREPHLFAVVHGEMMHFEAADASMRGILVR